MRQQKHKPQSELRSPCQSFDTAFEQAQPTNHPASSALNQSQISKSVCMGCGSMGTIVSLAHLYKLGNIAKSTGQCIHSRDVSNEQVLNICTLSPSGPKIYKLNLVSAFNKAKFHSLPLSNILNAVSGCTPKYRQFRTIISQY